VIWIRLLSPLYDRFARGAKILGVFFHGHNRNGGYVKFLGARGDGLIGRGAYGKSFTCVKAKDCSMGNVKLYY
jgi:hypothetical protein